MKHTKLAGNERRPLMPVVTALGVLRALSEEPMTADALAEAMGTSRATMFRLLAHMREQLGVVLESSQGVGYRIADWGVIDKRKF